MRLLLDTSVLIDTLRGRKGRPNFLTDLLNAKHILATSAVNVAELYAGMRTHEKLDTEAFLKILECYEVTAAVGRRAGKLKNEWARQGRTLSLPDVIVAAVALENQCVLVTDNVTDFPMAELKLYPLDSVSN